MPASPHLGFWRAAILLASAVLGFPAPQDHPCPCDNDALCTPITARREKEVWGFDGSNETYPYVDWSQLSMVLWNRHADVMCAAHAHGARIVPAARLRWQPGWENVLLNGTARDEWLASKLDDALRSHFDGINFDIEQPMDAGSELSVAYTWLVSKAADLFHEKIPGSVVSGEKGTGLEPNGRAGERK